MRPIKLKVREGSFFNPHEPAPSGGRAIIQIRIFEVINGALAKALPEKAFAAFSHWSNPNIGGINGRTGKPFVMYDLMFGGYGARSGQDGAEALSPVVNCANACATGATAFRDAWLAIKAGIYDLVLAVGVEQMGKGLLGGPGGSKGISKEGLLGSLTMPAVFAEAGMEHSRKHGTTFEQFAKVSVKNHHHSTLNPKAMYQIETPLAYSENLYVFRQHIDLVRQRAQSAIRPAGHNTGAEVLPLRPTETDAESRAST